jgi:hypothetical protein
MSEDGANPPDGGSRDLQRAFRRMEEAARTHGVGSDAFLAARAEVQARLQRMDALRDLVPINAVGDDLEEALEVDGEDDDFIDDLEVDLELPDRSIPELLQEIATLGASLSRIIPSLQEWEEWFEEDDEGRSRVLEQAYQGLMEADRNIHASAAVLHLFMTGAPPPDLSLGDTPE